MVRCDNCGWYNEDGATTCQKCGEPLNVPVTPAPQEPKPEEIPQPETTSQTPPVSAPNKETHPKPFSKTVRMGEPVSAPESAPAPTPAPAAKPNYKATVIDAGLIQTMVEEAPMICPKCHYPLSGADETCPNCGAALRIKSTRKDAVASVIPPVTEAPSAPAAPHMNATVRDFGQGVRPAPAPVPAAGAKGGKATIREIPKELLQESVPAANPAPVTPTNEEYQLVPLDGYSKAITLHVGEVVVIDGRQYRFLK